MRGKRSLRRGGQCQLQWAKPTCWLGLSTASRSAPRKVRRSIFSATAGELRGAEEQAREERGLPDPNLVLTLSSFQYLLGPVPDLLPFAPTPLSFPVLEYFFRARASGIWSVQKLVFNAPRACKVRAARV